MLWCHETLLTWGVGVQFKKVAYYVADNVLISGRIVFRPAFGEWLNPDNTETSRVIEAYTETGLIADEAYVPTL